MIKIVAIKSIKRFVDDKDYDSADTNHGRLQPNG